MERLAPQRLVGKVIKWINSENHKPAFCLVEDFYFVSELNGRYEYYEAYFRYHQAYDSHGDPCTCFLAIRTLSGSYTNDPFVFSLPEPEDLVSDNEQLRLNTIVSHYINLGLKEEQFLVPSGFAQRVEWLDLIFGKRSSATIVERTPYNDEIMGQNVKGYSGTEEERRSALFYYLECYISDQLDKCLKVLKDKHNIVPTSIQQERLREVIGRRWDIQMNGYA